MSGTDENIICNGFIKMPYNWSVGETGSRFFTELRDHKRIWGTKCTECGKVFIPPRRNCGVCMTRNMEWMELEPEGRLVTYTIVYYDSPVLPQTDRPVMYGLIKLDGADTSLLHLLGEVRPEDVLSGMRVEAVFGEKANGNIHDIAYFKPVVR